MTTVYVTHDQTEEMTLGQRDAVTRAGRVVHVDEPQTLSREPVDAFVAAFIGSPATNLVEAAIDGDHVLFGEYRDGPRRRAPAGRGVTDVVLGIRPETVEHAALRDLAAPDRGSRRGRGTGPRRPRLLHDRRGALRRRGAGGAGEDPARRAGCAAQSSPRVDPAAPVRVGERIELAVDPARVHFFDSESGLSLLHGPSPEERPATLLTSGIDHA